jgi:SAM-dependent methyltransferase
VCRIGSHLRCGIEHTALVGDVAWEWDPTLYSGSAAYYVRGRVAYPRELADCLAAELMLDGTGRLLDVGCGPGSLTLLLAGLFEQATGVDADADMLAEARRQAASSEIGNVEWVNLRAEALPASLGRYRVITLAQSFHWMDREVVARALHGMLSDDGALVHVGATNHEGIESDAALAYPRPPRAAIDDLIKVYLGPLRRAGQGTVRESTASGEAEIYRAAGFTGPTSIELPGRSVVRDADEIVASVFSLSSAAPHLFGERRQAFEAELRELLRAASPEGRFSEQMREIALDIWRA